MTIRPNRTVLNATQHTRYTNFVVAITANWHFRRTHHHEPTTVAAGRRFTAPSNDAHSSFDVDDGRVESQSFYFLFYALCRPPHNNNDNNKVIDQNLKKKHTHNSIH